jgi:hypothetical protein
MVMKKENRKLVSFTLDINTIRDLSKYSKTSGINKSQIVEISLKEKILRDEENYKLDSLKKKIETFKELQSIGGIKKEWLLKNILKLDDYE